MSFLSLDLHIKSTNLQIKNLLHCFTKRGNLSLRFYRAQIQLTKFSKLRIFHTPGKNLSVADMLSRSFTKTEPQLPPQIDFAVL